MLKWYSLLLVLLLNTWSWSQINRKEITIQRVEHAPKVDGILDDLVWVQAQEVKDFVMFKPGTGTTEPDTHKTVVKLCYDNEAIYVGAYLYDDNPSSIPMQFTTRDNFGQTDFFLLSLNPANDGINDTEFVVMSTGTQADAKVSDANGEDFGWSAVWDSATNLTDKGWIIEMKIPYSALRFSNQNVQTWGLNIHRRIQSRKEQYCWNHIDKSQKRYTEYNGLIHGITNIEAPLRLSLYPYAQGAYTFYEGEKQWKGTAGMDIKYGINDSFTLDATLIPDFSQTSFDDVVVNLGPFEQQYEEKRAFFTEGTELFAKGDLFYSRRIGETPKYYYDVENQLNENESIIENPEKTRLLNAVKFSGRTKSGLGIGVFNATTLPSKATILNEVTQEKRTYITSPLTNYNALVVDQQFKNTSTLTLVNSNVMRNGSYYDANVLALLSNIRLAKDKYAVGTNFTTSKKFGTSDTDNGYEGYVEFNKIKGKNRWGVGSYLSDTRFDKNDFGIQNYNNYVTYYANYSYRIFEPMGNWNQFSFYLNANVNQLYKPSVYTNNNFNLNLNITDKNELSYGFGSNFHIGYEKDYYEPRVAGRYFLNFPVNNAFVWISTDYRKKLAIDATFVYGSSIGRQKNTRGPYIEIAPRYRFSDQFQMIYTFNYDITENGYGFVKKLDDENIIFGNRKTRTVVNGINATYNFSTKDALSFSLRHYWFPMHYNEFYVLKDNGQLGYTNYTGNHDYNFNAWNLDLNYIWEFAPGSQLVALYRNNLQHENNTVNFKFFKNIQHVFDNPLSHQFSLKFVYYFDVNKIRS